MIGLLSIPKMPSHLTAMGKLRHLACQYCTLGIEAGEGEAISCQMKNKDGSTALSLLLSGIISFTYLLSIIGHFLPLHSSQEQGCSLSDRARTEPYETLLVNLS